MTLYVSVRKCGNTVGQHALTSLSSSCEHRLTVSMACACSETHNKKITVRESSASAKARGLPRDGSSQADGLERDRSGRLSWIEKAKLVSLISVAAHVVPQKKGVGLHHQEAYCQFRSGRMRKHWFAFTASLSKMMCFPVR